jgi:FMN-dependent NADH-azoreductase
MIHILYIRTGPCGSASRTVGGAAIAELREAYPNATTTLRDLAAAPVAHLDQDLADGHSIGPERLSEKQRETTALSDELIQELLAADVVVIAAPMINFGIPSTLKAWIDHVTRGGRTFAYTEGGPRGLVKGKQVILVTSHTGIDASARRRKLDHGTPYLRQLLAFLGMTDISLVAVEADAPGAEAEEKAVASGREHAVEAVRDLAYPAPGRGREVQALVSF